MRYRDLRLCRNLHGQLSSKWKHEKNGRKCNRIRHQPRMKPYRNKPLHKSEINKGNRPRHNKAHKPRKQRRLYLMKIFN